MEAADMFVKVNGGHAALLSIANLTTLHYSFVKHNLYSLK